MDQLPTHQLQVIAAHPDVDLVSFTGSTRAGRRISEVAAQTLKTAARQGGVWV